MSDLLPCPFCGGAAGAINNRNHFLVGCGTCNATVSRLDEGDAVHDWNRRPAVSGERVREACAKVCEAKAKELTDVAAVHEKGSTSKVILILQARTATELAQALYALPLAAQQGETNE